MIRGSVASLASRMRASLVHAPDDDAELHDPSQEEEPPSLIELIDEVNDSQGETYNFFRPSMLHGCDRANVFHYNVAPYRTPKHAPRMLRILDNGTKIHELVQQYLGDSPKWWFAREARIYKKVAGAWVRGSCDGVLIRRSDLYRMGVEIKTINHAEWLSLAKPKPMHVLQACVYARLQGLKWIVILYWDKGTQNLKEFPVRYNAKRWKEVKQRVRALKKYVDEKRIPAYNPTTCDPSFCGFVEHCRKKGAPV